VALCVGVALGLGALVMRRMPREGVGD
jgi:hypothetical protein